MNEFTKLMIDAGLGRVQNYSDSEADQAIRNKFYEVLGVSEDATGKQIRKALRKTKYDVFEIIEETVEELLVSGWGDNPFFRELVDVRNLALGDKNSFYVEDTSILTVSEFSGGHHSIIRQKLGFGKEYSIKTSWYGIKIYEEFERFMAGRVDWARFVNKLYEAVDKHVNDMLFLAFQNLSSYVPSDCQVSDTTVSLANLVDLAGKIETATGRSVMLAGIRSAITGVVDSHSANWISEDMKKQRNTTGTVAYVEGYRTLIIPQVFLKNTRTPAYSGKTIYVLPETDNKPIKLVNEGESQFYEVTDGATNMDMTITAEYQFKMGIAVIFGVDLVSILGLTSIFV